MIFGKHTLAEATHLASTARAEINGLLEGHRALSDCGKLDESWSERWLRDVHSLSHNLDTATNVLTEDIRANAFENVDTAMIPAERSYRALSQALESLADLRGELANFGTETASFGGEWDAVDSDMGADMYPVQALVTTSSTGIPGRLLVRPTPSAGATRISAFEHGETVTITGPAQNGFYPVTGQGVDGAGTVSGWSTAAYLTIIPAPAVVPTPVISPAIFTPVISVQPAVSAPNAMPSAPINPNAMPAPPPIPVAAPTPAAIATKTMAIVSTQDVGESGRLLVRKAPSETQGIVGRFAHGQMITITGPAVAGYYPATGTATTGGPAALGATISGYVPVKYVTPAAGGLAATLPLAGGGMVPVYPAPAQPAIVPTAAPSAAPIVVASPHGGLLDKWRGLSTKEKVAYGAGGAAALGLIWYLWKKR